MAQWMRSDDFVAISLEARANDLPPSRQEEAAHLRSAAKSFRESGRTGIIFLPAEGQIPNITARNERD